MTTPNRPEAAAGWSEDELRSRIESLGEWFQNLDLGGVQTAPGHFLGDYPRIKWERFADALPRDLSGQRVLEIGCNAGFYSMEMKRRGAQRVVGIDTDSRYLAQGRFAAEYSGLDIEFRQMSVYDVAALGERFDLVLFLGVLYHLRHPLLALDLLYDHVVGNRLVVQSMLRGSTETMAVAPDYPFSEQAIFDQPAYPRLFFVERRYAGDQTNWWIPNRAGLEAMLRSAGFAVESHPEAEVFVCRRLPTRTAEQPPSEEPSHG
jgi:tRNA (mo5U34)-methyltransferase